MKKMLLIALLSICQFAFSQDRGTVKGKVTDKEMNGEALPFANVFIKGTSIGGTTDMNGGYSINAPVGSQTIVFSFVGYETVEKQITIKAGQTLVVNQGLGANQGVALDEVQVKATVSREKETALLLEQKKAVVIKESIGAQELAKKGVSDAATATTKISGVTKTENSGDIYIRGLGDRYLSTTMNGLPIPSDNVDKKNINLSLFSTNVLQNVGISKTYTTSGYADQASGNVDIVTKEYTKDKFSLGVSGGANINALNVNQFRRTIIGNDVTFGFHKKQYAIPNLLTLQGWDTQKANTPLNYGVSLSGAKKFDLFGKQWRILATASYSKSNEYREELFRAFRSNILDKGFPDYQRQINIDKGVTDKTKDAERFIINDNITGYLRAEVKLNDKNKLKYNTLFVNKGKEILYESGRKGFGYVFDQDPQQDGAFVRDQNFKQTTLFINQLMGEHQWNKDNKLKWAGGYNFVLAEEPNRIRNEVNILDITQSPAIQFAHVGGFQQRKSSQKIEDIEYNALVSNAWKLGYAADEYEEKPYTLNYGLNFRKKERSFKSVVYGYNAMSFTAPSVDQISQTLQQGEGIGLEVTKLSPDLFQGDLKMFAGYVNFDFKLDNKLSGNLGLRYEQDEINMLWDVGNFVGRIGTTTKSYESLYPSANLKYEINERNFFRFASSVTQTLPELKELSPFEYVTPTGRVIAGNIDLEKSDVYNVDIKWEFFPSRSELVSATMFYKQIRNPINLAQAQGSAGLFKFFNTGEQADVVGLEVEGKLDLIKNDDEETLLNSTANVTAMWFEQDLHPIHQYNNKTTSALQGASNFIFNGSLTYSNKKEKEFMATLTGNYSSDKIFALGSPEDFDSSATLYNDAIIEKGFFTLDLVVSKQILKGLSVKLTGKNLLDPSIDQTQKIRNINTGIERTETVLSYNKGQQVTLGITYNF